MRRIGLFLVMAMFSACSTRSGGSDLPPSDAGVRPMDATPGADGGGTDAGHLADGAPIDAGAPVDGSPAGDAGPGMDAAVSCSAPLVALPPAALPRCTAATHSCIDACVADAGTGSPVPCVAACEADDLTPSYTGSGVTNLNCGGCLNREQRRCIQDLGCASEVSALDCCVAAHCPDGSCVGTMCMTEYSAFSTCATTTAAPCSMMPTAFGVAHCFADVDAGS